MIAAPERELLLAVLRDGLFCALGLARDGSRRYRGDDPEAEALAWIASEDTEWAPDYYPFAWLCEALGLEPSWIRREVQRLRAKPRIAIRPLAIAFASQLHFQGRVTRRRKKPYWSPEAREAARQRLLASRLARRASTA